MPITNKIAKQLRDLYFGGNWTTSSYKEHLSDLTWEHAIFQFNGLNSIATLTYHATYYTAVLIDVLEGKPLTAKDEYSFQLPPITSQDDWDVLLAKVWDDAEKLIQLIENLPENHLDDVFFDEKYGDYFRNIEGLIEHLHYHLGQLVLIKKLI